MRIRVQHGCHCLEFAPKWGYYHVRIPRKTTPQDLEQGKCLLIMKRTGPVHLAVGTVEQKAVSFGRIVRSPVSIVAWWDTYYAYACLGLNAVIQSGDPDRSKPKKRDEDAGVAWIVLAHVLR